MGGQYQLNADDDNFVTRWLVSNRWKTWIQYNPQCEIETTLENNIKFLYQCSRWARSNWRSNYTSMVIERHVWRQQPWSTYALHIATFTSLSIHGSYGALTRLPMIYQEMDTTTPCGLRLSLWLLSSRSSSWLVCLDESHLTSFSCLSRSYLDTSTDLSKYTLV